MAVRKVLLVFVLTPFVVFEKLNIMRKQISRIFPLISMLLVFNGLANAQTYLTDSYQPTDSYLYEAYPTKGSQNLKIAIYNYKGGFALNSGKGGLISGTKTGFVEFSLKGAYSKLSFVVGPGGRWSPNSGGDGTDVILTIKGDGEKIFDQVIRNHDAPKEYTVDISGVDKIRFDLPHGETNLGFGAVKLWKPGQQPVPTRMPLESVHNGKKVQLVEQLFPHYIRHSGWVAAITGKEVEGCHKTKEISLNRVNYTSGLEFTANQALAGNNTAWAYFWLQQKYDKLSFVVGPRDNQSSGAAAWLTVKGDGKILYEKHVTQKDLAEQVVLDVEGVDVISFHSIDDVSEFGGGIVFGVVDIYAYPAGDASVPTAGIVNASKDRLAALQSPCKMVSNIPPYSVKGIKDYKSSYFNGESDYYTFSMGGEQFSEGFILTSGEKFFDGNISAYFKFDLAGEFDYVSFTAGTLTQHRVFDDDYIRVYADDQLILDTKVHCTWPNQRFELPIGKCRTLTFAKPGTGKNKQTYIGIGDVVLYRGPVVANNLFVHPKPDCPETADLIDLCKRPYFHYVGRYLSSLTNFDFNDCFKNGTSQREFFQMKDGSKIYKGVMLEANVPLSLENVTLDDAVLMFLTGVTPAVHTSSLTSKPVDGKAAGVKDEAGNVLHLMEDGKQSSVAAFNVYKEYETCTFTVANKSVYVDPMAQTFGGELHPPVKLDVFADRVRVGEIWLTDDMAPTTYTVPIYKCEQLMFWLECGDVRSGQYVLYDMTLSKIPYSEPSKASNATRKDKGGNETNNTSEPKKKQKKEKQNKKEEAIVWEMPKLSKNKYINDYLKDCDAVWKATKNYEKSTGVAYSLSTTYLQGDEGVCYKAVSFVDGRGNRLSVNSIIAENEKIIADGKTVKSSMSLMGLKLANASLALPELGLDAIAYGKILRQADKMVTQCEKSVDQVIAEVTAQNETLRALQSKALVIGQKASTDKVLLLPLDENETVPEGVLQQVRYFNMD